MNLGRTDAKQSVAPIRFFWPTENTSVEPSAYFRYNREWCQVSGKQAVCLGGSENFVSVVPTYIWQNAKFEKS